MKNYALKNQDSSGAGPEMHSSEKQWGVEFLSLNDFKTQEVNNARLGIEGSKEGLGSEPHRAVHTENPQP